MTDRLLRQGVIISTTLTVLAVLFDAPSSIRVPLVLSFAFLGPGLALSRFIPTLTGIDRFAFATAASLASNVLASLLLVALGQWRGAPVLVLLAVVALLAAVAPLKSPWRRRDEQRERLRNEQIRERRRAQGRAYELVQSHVAEERREGLMALSWLLIDDDRSQEAARLRSLSRLSDPPRLLLGETAMTDTELLESHERARSEDPETRRRGLLEVAVRLDGSSEGDQATQGAAAEQGER